MNSLLTADPWPDDVRVPSFGPRMVCTRCGIIGADARPNWQEQPARVNPCESDLRAGVILIRCFHVLCSRAQAEDGFWGQDRSPRVRSDSVI